MFDRYATVLLMLAAIALAAMIARWLADRFSQPSVLAELLLGLVIGNVGYLLGIPSFVLTMHVDDIDRTLQASASDSRVFVDSDATATTAKLPPIVSQTLRASHGMSYLGTIHAIWFLANLGVLLLLFKAGLESSMSKMRRVGWRAFRVAGIGIAAPFAMGAMLCYLLHPGMIVVGHLFLAAALSATSVSITARVFEDLNRLDSDEAKVILAAAVIDDILGLILLAIVAGVAAEGTVNVWSIGRIALFAALFLVVLFSVGERIASWCACWFLKLDRQNAGLLCPLGLALAMAWLADAIQLAPIVGAFAAGLILDERAFVNEQSPATISERIAPLERFLAPVFFLFTGMQVNLAYFLDLNTLLLAAGFTTAAIVGKVAAGWGAGRGLDRLTVGIAMVPRGEVGLIFLSVGRGLNVISQPVFAALLVAIILTTIVTPPALKWSLFRHTGNPRET